MGGAVKFGGLVSQWMQEWPALGKCPIILADEIEIVRAWRENIEGAGRHF